jgi:hypothetical protein
VPSWGSALATVAACGGVGSFIDFYIGKRGQQRVRSWLETWWLRLSYVQWDNLGREEARFAVAVMDRLFGDRLFSVRRLIVVTAITVGCCVYLFTSIIFSDLGSFRWPRYLIDIPLNLVRFFIAILLLAVSFSITRFASRLIARVFSKSSYLNFVGVIILLGFQYIYLFYWVPISFFYT